MVCDITNLRYNYSKWRRFGTTSTKNPDFSCLQPKHVTGISSTPGNPHKPRLGLRSPSSNARQLFCGKKPELTKTKKEKIFNRQWELMFNAGNFPVFSFLVVIVETKTKMSPRRGIEPRSPAWQAGILTTILPRTASEKPNVAIVNGCPRCARRKAGCASGKNI